MWIMLVYWSSKFVHKLQNFKCVFYKLVFQYMAKNKFIGDPHYEVVPTEFTFAQYDLNGDKRVSLEEFARHEAVSRDDAQLIFDFADFDGKPLCHKLKGKHTFLLSESLLRSEDSIWILHLFQKHVNFF